ncbi:hypothetical protein CANCADRAFT_11505, partial [Tortispora caseinolytica NRRL Y-17796]
KKYLVVYNVVSTVLWLSILCRLVVFASVSAEFAAEQLMDYVRVIQTGAVLEIVHAALGWVRADIATVTLQVFSRLVVVWMTMYLYPFAVLSGIGPYAFVAMVAAWSVTETIRYLYYAVNLLWPDQVPRWIVWLRYTLFYVLYPTGVAGENIVLWKAAAVLGGGSLTYLFRIGVIAIYIPGFYFLFTHMVRQRKRVYKK